MSDRLNFSRFKSEINLTGYAAHLGYQIDRKKSTRNSIVMHLTHADKIIISKRDGNWIYFSVFDDKDNGTIINFIKTRTDKSLFEIGKELQIWLGSNIEFPQVKSYVQDIEEKKIDPERIRRLFNYCSPVTEHAYLKSRGITEAVLRSSRFYGRIFQDRYDNAVFPHFKNGVVCGLELKGENTGVFVRGSEKTLWRSNIKKQDDCLIISEAPIDAMSYQILHSLSTAFYVATCGGFSAQQSSMIKALVTDFSQIKKVILITDNNQGGDTLANRLTTLINQTNYQGLVTRHSPDRCGFDWNDALKSKLNL